MTTNHCCKISVRFEWKIKKIIKEISETCVGNIPLVFMAVLLWNQEELMVIDLVDAASWRWSKAPPTLLRRADVWSPPQVSDLFLPLLCQQLWPSLSPEQRLLKDVPIGWHCTSCLPSPCRWLPRCERSGGGVATWWSRGIDGAKNDEEMRGGDRQAAKMSVSLFVGDETKMQKEEGGVKRKGVGGGQRGG